MKKKLTFVVIIAGLLGASKPAHAAGRVSLSPTPITLTEGQSRVVTVRLDEPIIGQDADGYLNLTITITNPSRLTTTSTTLSWTQNNWSENRTFTLDAVDDQIVNGDVNDIVDISVDSNSEYYSGFQPTFVVNVLDNDVELPAVLPSVGSAIDRDTLMILLAMLAATSSYWLLDRYRRQT